MDAAGKKRKRPADIQRSVALRRILVTGEVDDKVTGEDDLGNGNEGVALLQQTFDDGRQGLGGMLGGVVEQNDGAGTFYG